MKDPRKIILLSTIVLLSVMFGFTFLKELYKKSQKKTVVSNVPTPTIMIADRADWTLFRNGYAFPLPPDWKNSSDRGGTAVLEPTDISTNTLGTIQRISTTILSDKKASGQRFTTEREFGDWGAVKGEVQGKIQKLDDVTVDGEKALLLIDRSVDNKWTIIVWTRREQMNFYINFGGVGKYGAAETETINYIISHFNFVAPERTEKEGKN